MIKRNFLTQETPKTADVKTPEILECPVMPKVKKNYLMRVHEDYEIATFGRREAPKLQDIMKKPKTKAMLKMLKLSSSIQSTDINVVKNETALVEYK